MNVSCCGKLEKLSDERQIPFELLHELMVRTDENGNQTTIPTGVKYWIAWTYHWDNQKINETSRKYVVLRFCPFCGAELHPPDYLLEEKKHGN